MANHWEQHGSMEEELKTAATIRQKQLEGAEERKED
jgi:hypothetical protein